MPVEDGWSIIENEVNEVGLMGVNLLLPQIFFAVRKFIKLPEAQPKFEAYFPNWVQWRDFVLFVIERAGGYLEEESKLMVFHMDGPQQPGAAWSRVVSGPNHHYRGDKDQPRKDIYINPSKWDLGSRLATHLLQVGADWKTLIGCETLVLHVVLETLSLDIFTPKEHCLPPNFLDNYHHLSNQEVCEYFGVDFRTFDPNQQRQIRGLRLCEEAAKDPYLQQLTLTNANSFVWFCKHVWLIMNGKDLVDGIVVESDLVNTNPEVRAIRDALPAVADHYFQAELV